MNGWLVFSFFLGICSLVVMMWCNFCLSLDCILVVVIID